MAWASRTSLSRRFDLEPGEHATEKDVDVGDDEKAFASVDTAKLAADAAAAKK